MYSEILSGPNFEDAPQAEYSTSDTGKVTVFYPNIDLHAYQPSNGLHYMYNYSLFVMHT